MTHEEVHHERIRIAAENVCLTKQAIAKLKAKPATIWGMASKRRRLLTLCAELSRHVLALESAEQCRREGY